MIDLAKLCYDVVAVTPDGEQLNLTEIVGALGWSEGEKELAAKITFRLANVKYKEKFISDVVQPMTPIFIYADLGEGAKEMIRGTVNKWELNETNGEVYLNIEAADEALSLRHNQDDFYFTEGHTSTAILTEVFNKWGVPFKLDIKDVKHTKKVYRRKYLSDIVTDVLKDIKEKGGGGYFARAKESVIEIIPRGTNDEIYHFDIEDNLIRTHESFDITSLVTRVKVVAKQKEEGHQKVEAVIDGKTEYGVRQVIYERGDKTTLEEAEKAAKKILDEKGEAKRKTSLESPDLPFLRKGDKIRVHSNAGEGYFFIKAIRHNAASMKMNMELDESKDDNAAQGVSFDTAHGDESNSSETP